jgi:hypothetical protein
MILNHEREDLKMTKSIWVLIILSNLLMVTANAGEAHIECIDKNKSEEIYIKFKESFFGSFDYCYSDKKRGVTPEDNYDHEIYELDGNLLWMLVTKYPNEIAVDVFDYVSIMRQRIGSNISISIDADKKETIQCTIISKSRALELSPCAEALKIIESN